MGPTPLHDLTAAGQPSVTAVARQDLGTGLAMLRAISRAATPSAHPFSPRTPGNDAAVSARAAGEAHGLATAR